MGVDFQVGSNGDVARPVPFEHRVEASWALVQVQVVENWLVVASAVDDYCIRLLQSQDRGMLSVPGLERVHQDA